MWYVMACQADSMQLVQDRLMTLLLTFMHSLSDLIACSTSIAADDACLLGMLVPMC